MERANKGDVGRARPARPSVPFRAIGRVPINRRVGATPEVAVPRPYAVSHTEAAAAAESLEAATDMLEPLEETGAIFVDRSGRRGQRLRRVAYSLVALALMLIVAFWALEGADVFGWLA